VLREKFPQDKIGDQIRAQRLVTRSSGARPQEFLGRFAMILINPGAAFAWRVEERPLTAMHEIG
jgi:hypothetical protein